jgi:hypothetical protein
MTSAESLSLMVIIARSRSRVGPSSCCPPCWRRRSSATSSIALTTLAEGYRRPLARPRSWPRVSITAIETCPPRRRANRHALLMAARRGIAVSERAKTPLTSGAGSVSAARVTRFRTGAIGLPPLTKTPAATTAAK